MGLADWIVFIAVVENLRTQGADVGGIAHRTRLLRLSAAVDTTAWAAHNLDEMVICLSGFYLI